MKKISLLFVVLLVFFNFQVVGPLNVKADTLNSVSLENKLSSRAQAVSEQQSSRLKNASFSDLERQAGARNASSLNSGNESVAVSPKKSSALLTSEDEIPVVTTVTYHTSEDYYEGSFRLNFWIDSIVGPAPYAIDAQLEFYSEPSLSGPVSTTTTPLISKVGDVTTGLLGSVEVPARTTFFAVGGECTGSSYFINLLAE